MSLHQNQLETKMIHAPTSCTIEQKTGAVNVPIYLSSTYHQENFDNLGAFDYSRSSNPTRLALEETIAQLEAGTKGFAFSSGMAAITSAFMLLSAGDHVIVSEDVYGGTYRFITTILDKFLIEHTFVDMSDLPSITKAIKHNTKVIYIETPSNPCLGITDIKAVVAIAKANNCLTFLDNTFMTPLYQQPLTLGIDVVLHSATKFLSGHSDVIAGLAVTKEERLASQLGFIQNTFGSILGAQDAYTLLQGIKTLGARLKQSTTSAHKIARFLEEQSIIDQVFYPGLKTHDNYSIHAKQTNGDGAVLSFRLPNKQVAKTFVEHVTLPVFAVSLGAVESILSYPATMSHAAMPQEEREKRGITDGLLRLSVGLEHPDDLIADLEQALHVASQLLAKT